MLRFERHKLLPCLKRKSEIRYKVFLAGIFSACLLNSCLHTRTTTEISAGTNLGFEVLEKGLPVNWIFYDPPGFDYRILPDSSNPKEGRYALHFEIRKSSDEGRINFAGFTNEFREECQSDGKYRLTFWLRNKGCRFRILVNAVNEKTSAGQAIVKEESARIGDWKQYSIETSVPAGMWLRFEIQLKEVGDFYIDDVKIRKI